MYQKTWYSNRGVFPPQKHLANHQPRRDAAEFLPDSNHSHGTDTFVTLNSTWVPSSSFTSLATDKITGPGVLLPDPALKRRPFSPKTPRGIPALIGFCSPAPERFKSIPEPPTLLPGEPYTETGAPDGRMDIAAAMPAIRVLQQPPP